jgi:hypothetical protein
MAQLFVSKIGHSGDTEHFKLRGSKQVLMDSSLWEGDWTEGRIIDDIPTLGPILLIDIDTSIIGTIYEGLRTLL